MEDSAFTSSSLTNFKLSMQPLSSEEVDSLDKSNEIVLSNVSGKTDDLSKPNGAATVDNSSDMIESVEKIQSSNLWFFTFLI